MASATPGSLRAACASAHACRPSSLANTTLSPQTNLSIANARTHRADLEALVETSPVGVAVFEARTGHPVSLNREARRIVEGLRTAGRPAMELLQVITCRFADGREIALDQIPFAQVLGSAETMRAEEIVLSVPDGRSVTTLMNATPIRTEGGEVFSVVVTLQDLTPLQELERLRAEFLGMVSHELRAPLTSIRGSAATLLESASELDSAERHEFFRIIHDQAEHMRGLISDLLDAGRIKAGTLSVKPEPSEVADLVDRARNTFLSGGGRHPVLIDLPLDLPPVMADRRRIVQVLNNLLSNAARHSLDSSPIRVAAMREGVHVAVSVSDEGRGVAPDLLPHLFRRYAGVAGRDGRRANGGASRLASGWSSARGWWRRTAVASRPRAAAPAKAPGSPSPCPLPSRPAIPSRSVGAHRARIGSRARRPASWWWTTTRRRCATCATR